ncbi:hypothetical protein [uncultured Draconibacterium sp.]|uniref:tetratricopeptide repeat protein n=1 Tax=uncultured Draconibacterium sp. TaxID=1573823 RepID=UPI0025D0A747|nr:hypothetical protein [uncultured Draconibacterium sp.]
MEIKYIFIILLIALVSCQNKHNNQNQFNLGLGDDEKSVAIAEYAMKQQIEELKENQFDEESLNTALKVFDQITTHYPDSVKFLLFKGKILLWKKEYKSYIRFNLESINKFKNQASIYGSIGHAYYLLGDSVNATKYYKLSIHKYEQQIANNKNNTQMMFNRAFMFNFTEGKSKAIEELEKYRKKFPEDFYLNGPIHLFYDFDKEEYFRKITQKGNGVY